MQRLSWTDLRRSDKMTAIVRHGFRSPLTLPHSTRVTSYLSVALLFVLLASSGGSKPATESDLQCETAEDCFLSALPRSDTVPPEFRWKAKVDRLKLVLQRHPASIWAKRAGLLIGLILSEREPAEGIRYLRAAERDVPILQEYIRVWTAEAMLVSGDADEAAGLLESTLATAPEPLRPRLAFRAGEAWHRAGECPRAIQWLLGAVALAPQDPAAASALMKVAGCQAQGEATAAESHETLHQVWVRYPHTAEAREALARLTAGGKPWQPTADDLYARALVFSGLALHAEAVEELQKFLQAVPAHPRFPEAKAKLGVSLVRLKRYPQARQIFSELAATQTPDAGEAAVWLARIYLRLDEGERLLAMRDNLGRLSPEQKSAVLQFEGSWLEDHNRFEEALGLYQLAGQTVKDPVQRLEPLWRMGWIQYRTGKYTEAVEIFRSVLKGPEDPQVSPQVLYWLARALELQKDPTGGETYQQLCRQYAFSYYCQLAQLRTEPVAKPSAPNGVESATAVESTPVPTPPTRGEVVKDLRYRRALELTILERQQEAATELASLVDEHGRNREVMLELSTLLGEAGAHHHALRLARLYFRDSLERGGDSVPAALWRVAYPTVYLPLIKAYVRDGLDPFLAAAIIREESQYDFRAVSRVGAIGLMQLMPATALTLARSLGFNEVVREELFDQELNIRFGVRYLEQLLQQFSGNLIQTIAAYNAGPQAVSAWAGKYTGKEPDEFVELIPYQETRQYVKRVLRSYREYRRLGGETCLSRFLDKTC
jgi:peptidoglycan lytic transglycosylase